jgi:hypothetical protein
MAIVRGLAPLLLLTFLSGGCSDPAPPRPPAISDTIVPIQIDGTTIFVPQAWGAGRVDWPRPWRNGVLASNGGWGQFETRLGPLEPAGVYDQPKDGIFRASSVGQSVDPRDPFFWLSITFEFPLPSPKHGWWGQWQREPVNRFSSDMLDLRYHAPDEKPMPYLALLSGLKPDDGIDLGNGWRAVAREYAKRKLWLRFDASDWREHGGALPRRLAVSYSSDGTIWNHHIALSPRGWSIDFDTQGLPLSRWRKRHTTAETLYQWLRTPPAKRDAGKRFAWWDDIRNRPTH